MLDIEQIKGEVWLHGWRSVGGMYGINPVEVLE
jgi:hypothetical protein